MANKAKVKLLVEQVHPGCDDSFVRVVHGVDEYYEECYHPQWEDEVKNIKKQAPNSLFRVVHVEVDFDELEKVFDVPTVKSELSD